MDVICFRVNIRKSFMKIQSDNFEFHLPVSLYFGVESLQMLPQICKQYGTNILLVTSIDLKEIEKQIISILEQSNFVIDEFYLNSPEPTCLFIDLSAKKLAAKNYDCIIGLGGGSAMDMAKSLSIALTNPEQIWAYANLSYRPPIPILNQTIPVISIPTTAGTGSEVTPYAVLTNSEINQKGTIQDVAIFSKAAIIDPNIMTSMPNELTASTAMDAFAHGLESCMNISKKSPIAELSGIEAMKIILQYLPEILKNPTNLELRTKLSWASTLAGIAITHRGTTTSHAIAETMGGLIKIPHGIAVAISTFPVLKATLQSNPESISSLYDKLFFEDITKSTKYKAEYLVNSVFELLRKVGLNKHANDFQDISSDLSGKILHNVLKYKYRPLKQHPVEFNSEVLKKIIEEVVYA
jgi:alcohol dehydrogenase class IV